MAQTVIFALLGAFILSLTYVPMMSALFLSKKITHRKNYADRMMDKLEAVYDKILKVVLKFQNPLFFSVLGLFFVSVFIMTKLGGEFIPTLPEGEFYDDSRVLHGSNLRTSTDSVLKRQQILLKKIPESDKIVGKTGRSEIPTEAMPIDTSEIIINHKWRKEWIFTKSFNPVCVK